MSISIGNAESRLPASVVNYNPSSARLVGTALVSALADVLKEYDIAVVTAADGRLQAVVRVRNGSSACPACGRLSWRVYSRYWRTVEDVLSVGIRARLRVYARRFRCGNPACSQRIFAERLPNIPAWGRRSDRVTSLLASTALAAGGLPGRRIAQMYGLRYSRHTLLRAARQMTIDDAKAVRVLGVDDYAYRRGVSYGTLLYDHGAGQVIDLLSERSAELLAAWLRKHPDVQVITRDRGGIYAQGARIGAPQAIQVADRFHLMQNLGDCLEKIAQQGIRITEESAPPDEHHEEVPQQIAPSANPAPTRNPTRAERAKAATRQRRQDLQNIILELRQQGASIRAIARALHLHRRTIQTYLQRVPDNASSRQPSICDPHREYLRQRWDSGVHNGHQLYEEIKARGYTGSVSGLRHYLQPWRTALPPTERSARSQRFVPVRPKTTTISPRSFRRLVMKKVRSVEDERLLARVITSTACIATSVSLAQQFASAIRAHDVVAFDAWLDTATHIGGAQWRGLVESLRHDLEAVHNALTLGWSQGPVEGNIHRLKLIKRAMYGRGGHDLLRRRVIFHLPD